jgi:hypothetical protein
MRSYRKVAILTVVMLILGCSSIKVSQDYNLSTNYSNLKTYAWQSETQEKTGDPRLDNPLLDNRIRDAVDKFLLEKTFKKISDDVPDFYVTYTLKIFRRINSSGGSSGFSFGFGTFSSNSAFGISSGSHVSEYDESMLVIDFIETDSGDLLWRGIGTRRYSQHSKPEDTTEIINETVKKILSQFPPQQK